MKKLLILITIVLTSLLLNTGCVLKGEFNDTNLNVPNIKVSSKSIVNGELSTITAANKKSNIQRGENKSPEVSWEMVEGANYYAVIMFDESANWVHFFKADITTTKIEEGKYTDVKTYIGPYPPKSSGVHNYRIEVFAIKKQPSYSICEIDSKESYSNIVNHLNQVGDNSDNILARGYVKGTYENGTNKKEDTK